MTDLAASIRERLLRTQEVIAERAHKAGRPRESIRLVVVSKAQPLEVVQAAIEAGAKILGENYAEEAVEKMMALKDHSAVEWHMIGHVQRRKAKLVTESFALFQALDSLKLAEQLDHLASERGRPLPVLIEFNVGDEPTKYGWPAAEESRWPDLLGDMEAITAMPYLRVQGLMTMPPLSLEEARTRSFFQRLRRLRDFLSEQVKQVEWQEISMGTSADYPIAVEEGATLVRVGQAILGPRPGSGN